MLGHPKKMKEIIEYSYERALKEDTMNRAERLRELGTKMKMTISRRTDG